MYSKLLICWIEIRIFIFCEYSAVSFPTFTHNEAITQPGIQLFRFVRPGLGSTSAESRACVCEFITHRSGWSPEGTDRSFPSLITTEESIGATRPSASTISHHHHTKTLVHAYVCSAHCCNAQRPRSLYFIGP